MSPVVLDRCILFCFFWVPFYGCVSLELHCSRFGWIFWGLLPKVVMWLKTLNKYELICLIFLSLNGIRGVHHRAIGCGWGLNGKGVWRSLFMKSHSMINHHLQQMLFIQLRNLYKNVPVCICCLYCTSTMCVNLLIRHYVSTLGYLSWVHFFVSPFSMCPNKPEFPEYATVISPS